MRGEKAVSVPVEVRRSRLQRYAPVLLVAFLIGLFGFLADEVVEGDTANFDHAITMLLRENGDFANPWGPVWLEEAGRDITALGSVSILALIVIATVAFLAMRRRSFTALFLTLAVLSGTLISNVLKELFNRPRPDVEAVARVFTASFPSGHSTLSAVVYLTLAALLIEAVPGRGARAYFIGVGIFLTVIVGISRVYLGVHHPTDVMAGWLLGTSWAIICWVAYRTLMSRRAAHGRPDSAR